MKQALNEKHPASSTKVNSPGQNPYLRLNNDSLFSGGLSPAISMDNLEKAN